LPLRIRSGLFAMNSARTQIIAKKASIERGLNFIYRHGSKAEHFGKYGSFLPCCFALVGATSLDPELRQLGRARAKTLGQRWMRAHRSVPLDASPGLLLDFVLVTYALSRIGLQDRALNPQLTLAAKRFSAVDLLGFDPVTEAPPADLSYTCACGSKNQRGRKFCKKCRQGLLIKSRYRVWMDALANSYVAERAGVFFGARYVDVLRWLPTMHPYPARETHKDELLREAIFAATHVVYTLNNYGTYKLSPRWLPREFSFLKANVETACNQGDSELLGELLDSLKAFGLPASDPLIQRGTSYLLAAQNEDGSWGDTAEENIRTRFHATWTAVDGLRTFAWRGERLSQPQLKSMLNRWAR
jgi:hypothetical protein